MDSKKASSSEVWTRSGSALLLISLSLLLNSSCSVGGTRPPLKPEVGVGSPMTASYYGQGDGLHGRRTASGEIFDAEALTAAHRTFPFGTRLKVTNPENGKSVIVTVNDRGPFAKGRELDLSAGAARRLGMLDGGVHRVLVATLR